MVHPDGNLTYNFPTTTVPQPGDPPRNKSPAFNNDDDDDLNQFCIPLLVSVSQVIKGLNLKLSDKGQSTVDHYCMTRDLEERLAIHFALTVSNNDLLQRLTKPENWTLSEDLKKNVSIFVKAFLLSPKVTSYRGNSADLILTTMRDANVSGIPSESDLVPTKELLSTIGSALTTFWNTMKTKIKASTIEKHKLTNVADLAHDLISNTCIPLTLQLLVRLAWLHFYIKRFIDQNKADTWAEVDKALEKIRKRAQTEEELSEFFTNYYTEDKKKYGDPATTKHEIMKPRNIPSWIKTIDNHVKNVQSNVVAEGRTKRKQPDE
ncbi:hypothetical protein CPB84DRAFT_1853725 [Gymnopilus junonius]|uniref:Uncharacterized protein n=1 Tax=Gymnopilus junonius TaxID=109634 RepID=A0A9P5TFD5_GYMJU|nr:hypothetical protein CPB84DRAFT_1853725 [Gymnopilus junonius]